MFRLLMAVPLTMKTQACIKGFDTGLNAVIILPFYKCLTFEQCGFVIWMQFKSYFMQIRLPFTY